MKTKTYYTLAVLDDGQWGAQFGDYDRDVVKDELNDWLEGGEFNANELRLLKTADDQAAINAAIAELNYGKV